MIIINNSRYLKYKSFKFRCGLGKAGIGEKKVEGDNITPKGVYKIIKILFRKDRLKKIKSNFKLFKIKKNMGWCDDPKSKNYNKLILLPSKLGHEKLYRKDNIYDLILVLNYNSNPTIKNKGSAIFIHVKKGDFKDTKGCISLRKSDLVKIVSLINKDTKVIIN